MTLKNRNADEMSNAVRRRSRGNGFSMLELLVVMVVAGIMAVYAVMQIVPAVRNARAETAIQTVAGWMRRTQERAVDERRIYRLSFIAPQTLQVDLVNNTVPISFTFVQSIQLPNDVSFLTVAGLPTGANAPDGFG